jgi:hypothetical protein
MTEWLCSLSRSTKVLCLNIGATRHRMTLEKSLTAVCLKLPGRCILITCDVHRSLCVYGELSGGTVCQAGLLSKATASNSCQNNIGLSKLPPDSTLYHNDGYSFFFILRIDDIFKLKKKPTEWSQFIK